MDRKDVFSPYRFLLLDANVVAGYYLPESVGQPQAEGPVHDRMATLIDSVRNSTSPDIVLYIPTICVVEVYGTFAKYRFGEHNKQVPQTISPERYREVLERFGSDLSSKKLFMLTEFSRDHVDASHLINRIDSYMPAPGSHRMGSMDHVIIATGIQMARIHGRDNFAIVSTDTRLNDALARATELMGNRGVVKALLLDEACEQIGLAPGPHTIPRCLNPKTATDLELEAFFDIWPLPTTRRLRQPQKGWHREHEQWLVPVIKESGPLDRLPYSQNFELLYRKVVSHTGLAISRRDLHQGILNLRKAGLVGPTKKLAGPAAGTLFA